MIGVIVWSNSEREQAVIWCDDHAALAYLVGRQDFPEGVRWPSPGDMVELRDEVMGDLRCARAVRPLNDSPVLQVPRALEQPAASRPAHLTVVSELERRAVAEAELQVASVVQLETEPLRAAAS